MGKNMSFSTLKNIGGQELLCFILELSWFPPLQKRTAHAAQVYDM